MSNLTSTPINQFTILPGSVSTLKDLRSRALHYGYKTAAWATAVRMYRTHRPAKCVTCLQPGSVRVIRVDHRNVVHGEANSVLVTVYQDGFKTVGFGHLLCASADLNRQMNKGGDLVLTTIIID